jgi:carboxylesterase type B
MFHHRLTTFIALAALSAHSILSSPLEARGTSIVDLGYAKYQADKKFLTGITSFLGVRYAAAPVGDLRFKAPQSPLTTSGVQKANSQPKQCYQGPQGSASKAQSFASREVDMEFEERALGSTEDCLFLNVHVSGDVDASEQLPVIVWFHGGGYVSGSASLYDGGKLVTGANGQVVTVVVQYRLGLFGFLAGKEVKEGGNLNAGLLDQEFALKWVQSNIAKFGGDPLKVTIWGQSAGAGSVLQHVIAHGGQTSPPLFRSAITSSSYVPPQYPYDHEIPEGLFSKVVNNVGCSKESNQLACLRSVDISKLDKANNDINGAGFKGTYVFGPVIDGSFIQESMSNALSAGKTNGDVLLSIVNAGEGIIFVDPLMPYSAADYAKQVYPTLSDDQAKQVSDAYANVGFGTRYEQGMAIMAESTFLCPTLRAQASFAASSKKSWKGQFAIPPAIHLQDLMYYFKGYIPTGLIPPFFDNGSFVNSFSKSFFSVAVSGDPNVHLDKTMVTPSWPTFVKGGEREMLFGKKGLASPDIRVQNIDAGQLKRCAVWDSLAATTFQ